MKYNFSNASQIRIGDHSIEKIFYFHFLKYEKIESPRNWSDFASVSELTFPANRNELPFPPFAFSLHLLFYFTELTINDGLISFFL